MPAEHAPHTVVMTACLRPDPQFARQLQRVDPAERTRDYADALRFWLTLPDRRIEAVIFIENTLAPLDELAAEAGRSNPFGRACEFISVDCNRTPPGLHYGYAEFRMIDEGLARSRLYGGSRYLIKATGRYRFPAISRLLDALPAGYQVAVDSRRNRRFIPKPQFIVTAPLLLGSTPFFEQYLRQAYRQMHLPPPWRGQFIEDALYDVLTPLEGQPGVILRWPVNCNPAGIGANGQAYDTISKRLLALLRAAGRRVLPGWWF
jgi:hypothetical protein